MTDLPELYFRIRENGAAVFRINTANRERRIEMEQIAVVNTNRGDFKAQGDVTLTAAEERLLRQEAEVLDKVLGEHFAGRNDIKIDHLNLTAHWAQGKATDAQLEQVTDDLLMAMHDLRSVLVRKKADRLQG